MTPGETLEQQKRRRAACHCLGYEPVNVCASHNTTPPPPPRLSSIKLDAEIDYYRKLLDGEYERLSMPGSPSSTTRKLLKRTSAEVC